MGTKVCASRYETIIEKPMAMASGRNRAPGMPFMVRAGAKTARMQKRISSLGKAIARIPDRQRFGLAHIEVLVDVFNGHR